MPQVPINYLAVLGAALASMALGALWYGPLFGKEWAKLAGVSLSGPKPKMGKSYALMFVGALLMSYVLAHSLVFASAYLGASGPSAGIMVGVWNWLGFIAPVTLSSVLWEGKLWKLWFLNNGYYLILLAGMGIILSVWT